MKLTYATILGVGIASGALCGCHSTAKQPQFQELPQARARLPQQGDLVIKGANPGTTRDDLVRAIQRGFGHRIRTNLDHESDQKLADMILSGDEVTITGLAPDQADAMDQALRTAGASVSLVK
jgi:hypothetical protein